MVKNYSIYPVCGECPFFNNEDFREDGRCQLRDEHEVCYHWCHFVQGDNDVNVRQAERILHYHQKWRRHNGKKRMRMVNPRLLGLAIDCALRLMRKDLKQVGDFISKGCKCKSHPSERRSSPDSIQVIMEWRKVPGFAKYLVSNTGEVIRLYKRSKIKLKPSYRNGYIVYTMIDDSHTKRGVTAQRIVASAFIPNPKNLGIVKHKDGNLFNNNVSNLYWSGRTEEERQIIKIQMLRRYEKSVLQTRR